MKVTVFFRNDRIEPSNWLSAEKVDILEGVLIITGQDKDTAFTWTFPLDIIREVLTEEKRG